MSAEPPTSFAPHQIRPKVSVSRFWRLLPAGMRRRWWMFRPLDLLARHLPVFRKPKGLLAVRMDGIGDMVLFRNSLDHYAEAFDMPKQDIIVLGCESWAAIASEIFDDYKLVFIDEHAYARRPMYRFRINLMVRRLAPAVTVCDSYLRRAMMADSLIYVSAAPKTVVSMPYVNEATRAEFTFYLSQADEIIDTGPYPTHEIVRHANFVSEVAGKPFAVTAPQIAWPHRSDLMETDKPYAVLNPGSNEPGRRWPLASYISLAERLLAHGWRVAFVGTGLENWDGALPQNLSRREDVKDLTGKTSLKSLVSLMAGASLVVSNDTGPAHLSIAVGAPTVVIVGGGHYSSFVPYPPEATPPYAAFVNQFMDCYHCFWRCDKRASKHDVFPCVAQIPVEAVWTTCRELACLNPDTQLRA